MQFQQFLRIVLFLSALSFLTESLGYLTHQVYQSLGTALLACYGLRIFPFDRKTERKGLFLSGFLLLVISLLFLGGSIPGRLAGAALFGVRLLSVNLSKQDVTPRLRDLVLQVFRDVPCGTGGHGFVKVSPRDLDQVLVDGARWMVRHGYGHERDAEFSEAGGALPGAEPDAVSDRAKEPGRPQIGTLGSGNHFLEIQYVDQVIDPVAAQSMNLFEGQVVVLIHSGSRGLGHQVCTDYLREMGSAMARYGIQLPDRQLACVPVRATEGQQYLAAMD